MIGKTSSSTTLTNMPNQAIAQGKRKALLLSDTKQASLQGQHLFPSAKLTLTD